MMVCVTGPEPIYLTSGPAAHVPNKSERVKSIHASLSPVLVCLVLVSGCVSGDKRADLPVPQNLVIIVSDALRSDVLGCYGGEARTPNIDWLARHGVMFANAYSNSPWTAPSSVTMFTGNYPTTYASSSFNKTIKIHVPDEEVLLAELLAEEGFDVSQRIENGHARMHNILQGFESMPEPTQVYTRTPTAIVDTIKELVGMPLTRDRRYWSNYLVLSRILQREPDERFFVFYWIVDPHEPYAPIDRFKDRIDLDTSRLPQTREFYNRNVRGKENRSSLEQEYLRKLYMAEVESVDERVGYVLSALRYKGVLDKTCIVFTSDHGEQFGEKGLWGHGALGKGSNYYESQVRIPLIIFGPGLPGGQRRSARVSLIDLAPTLRDIMKVDPGDTQGKSLRDLVLEDGTTGAIYLTDVRPHDHVDALIEDDHKLIAIEDGRFELYDIVRDTDENENLADADTTRVQKMYETRRAWRKENAQRKARNITAAADTTHELSNEELLRTLEELKALGYIN